MEKLPLSLLILLALLLIIIASCNLFGRKKEIKSIYSEVIHPEWSKNSIIYEVNIRQYTDSGTFRAFEKHLPRLKKLGIEPDNPGAFCGE